MTQDRTKLIGRRTLLRVGLGSAGAVTVASLLAACGTTAAPSTSNPPPGGAPAAGSQPAPTSAPAVSAGVAADTLKIGLLSGFSGPYSAFGPDMASSLAVYL